MRTLISIPALLSASLLLIGCTIPGGLAKGVDPNEGRLVQKLTEESCGTVVTTDQNNDVVSRRKVAADGIAVLEINDTADGGRLAWIRFWAREYRIGYHPHYAMVMCDVSVGTGRLYHPRYTHASSILTERGGDPTLYKPVRRQEEQRRLEAHQQGHRIYDTYPLDVKWEGMGKNLKGALREMLVNNQGTLVVQLPKNLGRCSGNYEYTGGGYAGTWTITCPNNLSASGTFKAFTNVHAEGTDNLGRAVSYTFNLRK